MMDMTEDKKLGVFEKYLTLWIALCIGAGLLLGRFAQPSASIWTL